LKFNHLGIQIKIYFLNLSNKRTIFVQYIDIIDYKSNITSDKLTDMNGRLLIVDDHKQVLKALIQLLETEFVTITGISNPNQIINCIKKEESDVILLDMNFSAGVNTGNEGIYWLNCILKSDPSAVVVMMTA
jgi:response regulator RpfG family c-di-GMP phosphodiesterase